jgi:hypothetical protein
MKPYSYILICYYTKIYIIVNIIELDKTYDYYWWKEMNAEESEERRKTGKSLFGVGQRIIISNQACVLCDIIIISNQACVLCDIMSFIFPWF